MSVATSLLMLQKKKQDEELPPPPVAPASSWIKDLIDQRYQPKTERLKRKPVGFNFTREPFDPSSYYRSLNAQKNINVAATNVVNQEVANRLEAERQREYEASRKALQKALGGIDPRFTYGNGGIGYTIGKATGNAKYKLGRVSSNTASAANYFGNKYGIRTIGGYREKGSVPGSDHPKGRGLDYMINNIKNGKRVGDALANDVIKNAKAWNVKYVIWNRYIWFPGRGWKEYSGPSPHTDHVHVSFNK